MNCEQFRDAIVGDDPTELAAAERHATGCAECAQLLDGDRELAAAVDRWKQAAPAPPPDLESRIATTVERDSRSRAAAGRRATFARPAWWSALAASLLLALWFGTQPWTPEPESLTRVERLMIEADRARDRYVEMIVELERQAMPVLDRAGDPALDPTRAAALLRYRDRLSHLDSVIAEVRGFLEQNPGHSGGHTVLLAAYQEKQQLLGELLQIQLGDAS